MRTLLALVFAISVIRVSPVGSSGQINISLTPLKITCSPLTSNRFLPLTVIEEFESLKYRNDAIPRKKSIIVCFSSCGENRRNN